MRNKYFLQLLIVFFLVFTFGCDKIEEPFEQDSLYDGEYNSDLPIRKILLEDYTGFKCVNCPRAAEKIHSLQDDFGGHIVPLSIHFGFFATPNSPDDPDFITPEGTEIGIAFNLDPNMTPLPVGVVNRKLYNENYEVGYEGWSTKVTSILDVNHFADIGIDIISEYNEVDSSADITIQSTVISPMPGKIYLTALIVESHIFGKQKDGSDVIDNYEHNHVLRGAINGTWGEKISSNGVAAGDIITTTFENFHINSDWVPHNLSIIAIIYDGDSMEVIQAEEHELITE